MVAVPFEMNIRRIELGRGFLEVVRAADNIRVLD
jgi:hypothetical protein